MSMVKITDKRGGVFQVVISFTYGECDRLPYNAMRKVKARIEQVANGGIDATAEFNIRNAGDSANFVEVLELFGEDGAFVHGSSADPEVLTLDSPPEDEDASGIRSTATVSASGKGAGSARTESSSEKKNSSAKDEKKPETAKAKPASEEAEVEVEQEEDLVAEEEPEDLETEDEAETEVEGKAGK
ncbi:MAG: hypothetical protein JXR97_06940 [Planctomycetes bacterium]|nr:hypothetical protein [Planctomycetota bacterium]